MAYKCLRPGCPLKTVGKRRYCRVHSTHADKTEDLLEAEIDQIFEAALAAAKANRGSIVDVCGPQSGLARHNDVGRAGRIGKSGLLIPNGGY